MAATDEIFKKELHAWFSQKQYDISKKLKSKNDKKHSYSYIYRSCKTRENIEVTEVTRDAKYSSNYDDVKYLGLVDKYIETNYN